MNQHYKIWRCDLVAQYHQYRDEINAAIQRVLTSGRYLLADEVQDFEKRFAAYVGRSFAVGVANGTDGLILALKAVGVQPGDEVITTPFTAIPTVMAIIAAGARPVFVDIDENTLLIDIAKVSEAVTSKTRAVMPVHLFGNVVDITVLRQQMPEGIAIIEDAAQAHGSKIGTRFAGALGEVAVFSFYPTKNLGGYGDGGMVVTDDPGLIRRLRLLHCYGMVDKDHVVTCGENSRLDEIQAAVLSVKLVYLDAMNQARRRIAEAYMQGLDSDRFRFQHITDGVLSNFHVLAIRVVGSRDQLVSHLDAQGIQTNVYYPLPLHLQQGLRYLGYDEGDFPVAEAVCQDVMALPMYPELDMGQVETVIQEMNRFQEEA